MRGGRDAAIVQRERRLPGRRMRSRGPRPCTSSQPLRGRRPGAPRSHRCRSRPARRVASRSRVAAEGGKPDPLAEAPRPPVGPVGGVPAAPPAARAPRRRAGPIASTARTKCSSAGKPPRAISIAGASSVAIGRRPQRACASAQERTAPGTVIVSGPRRGSAASPRARRASASVPAGARPDPLSAVWRAGRPRPRPARTRPPEAARLAHHDRQDRVRRDRRVDRAAALPEDAETSRGR